MRLLVIQHDHVSPLGPIAERFEQRGYAVEEFVVVPKDRFDEPGVGVSFPAVHAYDAIVSMGSKWSTYDLDLIGSWVGPELHLLREADASGIPVLGICFGGQMLATAHGGSVYRTDSPEIGWVDIESERPDIASTGPWFQWHFDRWTLPPKANEIARNDAASQAFVQGRNLAVQFHPELTADMLQGWLDNGGDPVLRDHGIDPQELLHVTQRSALDARGRAHQLVDGFLDHVAGVL